MIDLMAMIAQSSKVIEQLATVTGRLCKIAKNQEKRIFELEKRIEALERMKKEQSK